MARALLSIFSLAFIVLSPRLPAAQGQRVRRSLLFLPQSADLAATPTPSRSPSPTDPVETVITPSSTPPLPPSTATNPATATPSASATIVIASPSRSPSATLPSETPTLTATEALSPTPVPGTPAPPSPVPNGLVVINEVGWAGTLASAYDEWIELRNTSSEAVVLTGWRLSDGGDIDLALGGTVAPFGYFLLERTDDTSISDVAADIIYSGGLNNGGETLSLYDPSGALIDSANRDGGGWPAGELSSRASMERWGGGDEPGNWRTYSGYGGSAHDAGGHLIPGTPRQPNSMYVLTPTPSLTVSVQVSSTPTVSAHSPGSVLINEIAWAGTHASAGDEWIELYNPSEIAISLEGWLLTDGGDIAIHLRGTLSPGGYYLLERTDDATVINIEADLLYTGSLSNAGETLALYDAAGGVIDSANPSGGAWPAGSAQSRDSMERWGVGDSAWSSFTGYHGLGKDAQGVAIRGTPRGPNSVLYPTPEPTWVPGKIVINEVLIRPHFDWQGSGGIDTGDEFIELLNLGPYPVSLVGWMLDDIPGAGSKPYTLGQITLAPGSYRAFFRSRTHLALNDSGDTVRLLAPDGRVVDSVSYLRVRAYNLSYGRYPDGSGHLRYGLWPTPGGANLPFDEDPIASQDPTACPATDLGVVRVPRLSRTPLTRTRLRSLGLLPCSPASLPP